MRSRVPRALLEFGFAGATLCVAAPALVAKHLPLQDLPQHLAAVSVLKRLLFGSSLDGYFTATLSRTQYLLVYALGVPLSVPFGVEGAGRVLVLLTVASIPYALRFALRRTGRDERLAALCLPLAWNPQMMLGFLNFLLGVPIALVALGLFADVDRRRTRRRQVALCLLSLAAFYAHLVPFGMLGLGALLMVDLPSLRAWWSERGDLRASLRSDVAGLWADLRFLVPSLLAVALWVLRTPATDASVRAGGVGVAPHAEWPAAAALPRELTQAILDFPGDRDERALTAWGLALLVALAAAASSARREGSPETSPSAPVPWWPALVPLAAVALYLVRHRTFAWVWGLDAPAEASWGAIALRALALGSAACLAATAFTSPPSRRDAPPPGAGLSWLPAALAALYFNTPSSYGWIWPIHTRFAVAAALTAPLIAPRASGGRAPALVAALAAAMGFGFALDVGQRFIAFNDMELGDLDQALDHARPGRRLVALVPAMASAQVPNVPVLHAAAYYQLRGGAVATFSFADFPQSPFRYREGEARPPRLPPRWEWGADLDVADPSRSYYDYVLCRRGGPETPAREPQTYARVYDGREWVLYERSGAREAGR